MKLWRKQTTPKTDSGTCDDTSTVVIPTLPQGARTQVFLRVSTVCLITIPLMLIHILLVYSNITLSDVVANETNMALWSLGTVVVPSLLTFTIGVLAATYILPMQDIKYTWWIIRQHRLRLGIHYVLSVVILCILVLISVSINNQISVVEGGSSLQYITIAGYVSYFIPTWMGFREGYRAYRIYGAQTMQDRWEAHNKKLEIQLQGQTYEKLEERVRSMRGVTRNVPSNAIVFFAIIQPCMIITGISLGVVMGAPWFASVWFILVTALVISLWAYVLKIKDMKRMSQGVIPRLEARRFQDTVDEWDASYAGIPTY